MKLTLDSFGLYDDFSVWALSSDIPLTRLCYFLNNSHQIRLCRSKKDIFISKPESTFVSFNYHCPKTELQWFLTANHSSTQSEKSASTEVQNITHNLFADNNARSYPLIPVLKHYDAFLWIYGDMSSRELEKVNETLKAHSYLKTFRQLDLSATKKIENLITHV